MIRQHSQAAAAEVKERGLPNDLIARLASDAAFGKVDLTDTLNPQRYIGRAPQQVDAFLTDVVNPIRARYSGALDETDDDLRV